MKYLRVFAIQFRNNFIREAVYRSNFLTMLLVDLIWLGVEFTLFHVIYSNTPTLAGWTREQTYFFLGMFFASDALFTTLFQRNFWNFSDLVNHGELDVLLTKPIHPLYIALTRWMNLSNLLNLFFGIIILIKFSEPAGFEGGIKGWLNVAIWLLVGLCTQLTLRLAFSIWVFWTDRSWALSRLYYQFFAFASRPDGIYPKFLRYTLMTALPFAFIGSVPARAVLHGLETYEYFLVVGVLSSFAALDLFLWKRGLLRYQSASS